jgi:ribosomal protein S18 acetylase RimI-like enzyme
MIIDTIRKAFDSDCEEIAHLVNGAYRPKLSSVNGWTHEFDLVSGSRIDPVLIAQFLLKMDSVVLLGLVDERIVACVHIQYEKEMSYIGMLAVNPRLQGAGIGKQMLSHAECYAAENYGARRCILEVISQRVELIEFYRRRGYQKTGVLKEYPLSGNVGFPKRVDLSIETMEKVLHQEISE